MELASTNHSVFLGERIEQDQNVPSSISKTAVCIKQHRLITNWQPQATPVIRNQFDVTRKARISINMNQYVTIDHLGRYPHPKQKVVYICPKEIKNTTTDNKKEIHFFLTRFLSLNCRAIISQICMTFHGRITAELRAYELWVEASQGLSKLFNWSMLNYWHGACSIQKLQVLGCEPTILQFAELRSEKNLNNKHLAHSHAWRSWTCTFRNIDKRVNRRHWQETLWRNLSALRK